VSKMFQEAPCIRADRRKRMKRAKLLLQKFPQSATDFVFFTGEKMFSVSSSDNRQNKVSGRLLPELLKKKLSIFFSVGTALSAAAWRLSTVPVSRNFLNSLLTRRFVQFSREIHLSTSLPCTPSNTTFFYQNLVLIT